MKVKIFNRRDSATAVLRKMGVKPEQYVKLITATKDHRYVCHVAKAVELLKETASPEKAVVPITQSPATKSATLTCAEVIRTLIASGKTNKEIWKVVQPQFKLADSKRHYPAWYRAAAKRGGSK